MLLESVILDTEPKRPGYDQALKRIGEGKIASVANFLKVLQLLTNSECVAFVRLERRGWELVDEFSRPTESAAVEYSCASALSNPDVQKLLGPIISEYHGWGFWAVEAGDVLDPSQKPYVLWLLSHVVSTESDGVAAPHRLIFVRPHDPGLSRRTNTSAIPVLQHLVDEWFTRSNYRSAQRAVEVKGLAVCSGKGKEWFENSILSKIDGTVPFRELADICRAGRRPEGKKWFVEVIWRCLGLPSSSFPARDVTSALAEVRRQIRTGRSYDRRDAGLLLLLRWQVDDPGEDWITDDERKEALEDLHALESWVRSYGPGDDLAAPGALLRFFLGRFWDGVLLPALKQRMLPVQEAQVIRGASALLLSAYGGLQVDERTIEAMVWAVARYAHEFLRVEPRIDIASHLLHSARNEPALHSLKPFYRDHFFHAIEVCFLGHYLLETWQIDGKRLLDIAAERMGQSDGDVLREWYVASLLHDNGYAIDVLASVRGMLGFYQHSRELNRIADGVRGLIDGLSSTLGERSYMSLRGGDKPGADHGVVSAVHLDSLIEHIGSHKNIGGAYTATARAMGVHNHRKPKIDFEKEPLSFLLILCDTLQEWNRPSLTYSAAPSSLLARLLPDAHSVEPPRIVQQFRVEHRLALPGGEPKIIFELHYGEQINRNGGVFNLWLDSSSNLQRLRHTGLPCDIDIRMVTPVPLAPRHSDGDGTRRESQMHRLVEAANETHMNFLADW